MINVARLACTFNVVAEDSHHHLHFSEMSLYQYAIYEKRT
jgi:hypothetical protein